MRSLVARKPLGAFGLSVVVLVFIAAIFANVIAPFDPIETNYSAPSDHRLESPNSTYLLGTDQYGRDILSRIIHGARISMYIGLGVAALGTSGATLLGLVSGYFGGTFDLIVQRFVDAFLAIPGLILLLAIMAALEPSLSNLIYALAIRVTFANTRIVRAAVVTVRGNQFVEAARAMGTPTWRILAFHILPNVGAPVIIVATLALGTSIFSEAALSFLGFGIPPPTATWGQMLSRDGISFMITAPWTAIAPGLALTVVIFSVNMLGDAMRDLLDPRLRGATGHTRHDE
jgi:peptide/nickel transport system permease protein